jgi:hypothetical protein
VVLPIIWINVLLLRRPLANASELEPILTRVENCRQEAHPFLCAGREPTSLPPSLLSLQKLWERYLEGKIKEQRFCSYGAGILVGSVCRTNLKTLLNCLLSFILGALQIAEKNDPLTRVFGFLAFAVLAFSLLANQLLSHHLDDKYIKEAHYAYHLLEVNFVLSAIRSLTYKCLTEGEKGEDLDVEYELCLVSFQRFNLVVRKPDSGARRHSQYLPGQYF